MYIFNLNNKANLIISKQEILFRKDTSDEQMQRISIKNIKNISVEKIYSSDGELFTWLKLHILTKKEPEFIQISSLDMELEDILQILEEELQESLTLELSWKNKDKKKNEKGSKTILILGLVIIIAIIVYIFMPNTQNEVKLQKIVKPVVQQIYKKKKVIKKDINNTKTLTNTALDAWSMKEYKKALNAFQKVYNLDSNNSKNFLNYYEISLATQNKITKEQKDKFENSFKDNKDIFIKYNMLQVIELCIQDKEFLPSLKQWSIDYTDTKLNWSFQELLSWLEESDFTDEKKDQIRRTIGFFIAYQQVYNLEHQKLDIKELNASN